MGRRARNDKIGRPFPNNHVGLIERRDIKPGFKHGANKKSSQFANDFREYGGGKNDRMARRCVGHKNRSISARLRSILGSSKRPGGWDRIRNNLFLGGQESGTLI